MPDLSRRRNDATLVCFERLRSYWFHQRLTDLLPRSRLDADQVFERVVAGFHFRGDVENGLFDTVQMGAGQFDGSALIAGLDVLDQTQMFVIAADFMAVVIQRGSV